MKSSKFSRLGFKSAYNALLRVVRASLTLPLSYAGSYTVPAASFLLPLSEIKDAGTISGKHDGKSGVGEALPRNTPRSRRSSSRLHTPQSYAPLLKRHALSV